MPVLKWNVDPWLHDLQIPVLCVQEDQNHLLVV